MEQHPKKRIDIVIETPLVERVAALLDRMDVSGYSMMPITAGRGQGRAWTADGQIGNAMQMTALACIVDASVMDAILDAVFDVVSQQIGFVTISDVCVIRRDRF